MKSAIIILLSTVLAAPTFICSQRIPDCENVECKANQVCQIIPETEKSCAKTVCKDITDASYRPCPKIQCIGCASDEICSFSAEYDGHCPTPVCTKATESSAPRLQKRLVCPEYFAPLCFSHECGGDEECIETPRTAASCPKAKCLAKRT